MKLIKERIRKITAVSFVSSFVNKGKKLLFPLLW
jgi:hypothetical protein